VEEFAVLTVNGYVFDSNFNFTEVSSTEEYIMQSARRHLKIEVPIIHERGRRASSCHCCVALAE
jgi:hypothetical protein